MPNHVEPLLLRMTEAARLIGVGRSTIYELANRGEIPVVRIGRAVRVPARALHEWAERLERDQG
jgi:excisionase family DNA binding protein